MTELIRSILRLFCVASIVFSFGSTRLVIGICFFTLGVIFGKFEMILGGY